MIKCKYCGESNSIDRILCLSCGKKLDFSDPLSMDLDLQEKAQIKPVKIRMAGADPFSRLLSYFIFILACVIVFLFLYTGHIPQSELKLSAAQSLDAKLKTFFSSGRYIALSEKELNVYLERLISPLRDAIVRSCPSYFVFKKCFASLGKTELMIHLLFKFKSKDIIFSYKGLPSVSDNKLVFLTHKTFAGKLMVPEITGRYAAKNIIKIAGEAGAFTVDPKISSIKIEKGSLILFTGTGEVNTEKTDSTAPDEANLPDDLLLIQAADNFYSRKSYNLAFKYYHIAVLKFPNSPLKSHAVNQMKACAEGMQGQ